MVNIPVVLKHRDTWLYILHKNLKTFTKRIEPIQTARILNNVKRSSYSNYKDCRKPPLKQINGIESLKVGFYGSPRSANNIALLKYAGKVKYLPWNI